MVYWIVAYLGMLAVVLSFFAGAAFLNREDSDRSARESARKLINGLEPNSNKHRRPG